LGVEPLEGRRLLTAFEVNSFDDSVDANLGDGVAADTLGRCTLRAAVMEANAWSGDDTINLPAGTYALSLSGPAEDAAASGDLDVTSGNGSLRIVGAGARATIISASAIGERILDVLYGATLQAESLTLTGGRQTGTDLGKPRWGGDLYSQGTVTVTGVTIAGGAAFAGGGIYNDAGTLTITESAVSENSAFSTSDDYAYAYGGGIYSTGPLTVTRSTVSLNEVYSTCNQNAYAFGGGIYNAGPLTITDSTLSGNSASSECDYHAYAFGGGIYSSSPLTVTDSTVSENSASATTANYSAMAYGGGIWHSAALTVTKSTVSGNSASASSALFVGYATACGGGIFSSSQTLEVTDSILCGNSATNFGGGVYTSADTTTITGSTLSENSADGVGGGVYIASGTATITNSPLSRNSASQGGGICILPAGTAAITDSNFSDNSASDRGGGIDNRGSLTIANCTLSGNSASVLFGGGIYNCGTLTIANCTLEGNSAIGSNGYGGGIWSEGALTISDSTVSGNQARFGGGIYGNSGSLAVTRSTLSGNVATGGTGGGFYIGSATATIEAGTLSGNSATRSGGGILNGGTLTIVNSTVSGNSSAGVTDYGGGIANSGTLTITDSALSGNSAASGGGISSSGTVTVTDSTLSGNSAASGGGISSSGTVTVTDSTLSGNSAASGGGIFNLNDGTLTITASTLSGNTASGGSDYGGGGILIISGTATITDSTLSGNSATKQGGGIEHYFGWLTITNSTLSGNTTASRGGGIYNGAVGGLTITGSTLSGNAAVGDNTYAGGIYSQATAVLDNTIVAGNTASQSHDVYGYFTANHCLIQDTTDVWIAPEGNILGQPAVLGPLGNYGGPTQTLPLLPGSPAIDSGSNSLVPAGVIYDQRGPEHARIVSGTVDIGAFEVGSSSFVVDPASGFCGGTTTISATLTVDTVPVAGQEITFSAAGQPLGTAATNSQGVATLSDVSLAGFEAGVYETGAAIDSGPVIAHGTLTVADVRNQALFDAPSGVLIVGGTNAADTIDLAPAGTGTTAKLQVTLNRLVISKTVLLSAIQRIAILGHEANDTVTVGNLNKRLSIAGGNGDDTITLTNLGGPVTVDGGADSDKLTVTGPKTASTFGLNTTALTVNGVVDDFSNLENLAVSGGRAADTFTVVGLPAFPVTLSGGGGSDNLQGPDAANSWAITSATGGTLGGTVSFVKIPNLAGGSDADTFTVSPRSKLAGKIDGGGGTTDTLNYANYGAAVTVNLQTFSATGTKGFVNVESFVGSVKADKLIGANQVNQWTITGPNAGTVNGTAFADFENLTGGTLEDTIAVADNASVTGKVDGGKGANTIDYSGDTADNKVNLQTKVATGMASFANIQQIVGAGIHTTLVGRNSTSTWNITADNTGTVGATAFANVGNLSGGTRADTFVLADGEVSGKIDGGAGKANVLSYAPYAMPITVDLTTLSATNVTGGIANFGSFVGGTSMSDTLVGPNQASVWTVSAANAGKLNAMPFTGFENLTGGAQADAFVFAKGIGISGQVAGGGGGGGAQSARLARLCGAGPGVPSGWNRHKYVGRRQHSGCHGRHARRYPHRQRPG